MGKIIIPGQTPEPQKPSAANPFKVWDYKEFLGQNIVGDGAEVPPFNEPPSDPKDYAIYRKHYENLMAEITQGQGTLKITVKCETRAENGEIVRMKEPKQEHFGSDKGLAYACDHIIAHDPVHPEDVHCFPFKSGGAEGYYICGTCYKLMMRCRFNIGISCLGKCGLCLAEAITNIMMIDPGKLIDHRFKR